VENFGNRLVTQLGVIANGDSSPTFVSLRNLVTNLGNALTALMDSGSEVGGDSSMLIILHGRFPHSSSSTHCSNVRC
jgi:hypothetical protein